MAIFGGELSGQQERADTVTVDSLATTVSKRLEATLTSAASGRSQQLRELGVSIASVDAGRLNQAPIANVGELLMGRLGGLVVQEVSGTTGTSQRIRLRGVSSLGYENAPAIYLDGVRVNDGMFGFGVGGQEPSRLNDLNPQDVEDIQVIRGPAAAAMYGTAGANGVILINTKRGIAGDTRWSFFAETGQGGGRDNLPGELRGLSDRR